MAKNLESRKTTAKHIKQHTSNMPGGAQIHILRHNCTSLPAKKKKAIRNQTQLKGPSCKSHSSKSSPTNSSHTIDIQTSVLDVVTSHMHKDSTALQRSTNENNTMKWTLHQNVLHKKCTTTVTAISKGKPKQAHQIIVTEQPNEQYKSVDESDDDDNFIIAYQSVLNHRKNVNSQRAPTSYTKKHLYANITYMLQPYHKHNKYLYVQLDTCSDVNLMPEKVYKLVFNDPHTSKLAKNDTDLTVYTRHSSLVSVLSSC